MLDIPQYSVFMFVVQAVLALIMAILALNASWVGGTECVILYEVPPTLLVFRTKMAARGIIPI